MGAPLLNGPFMMPMFRPFVPRRIQPWIYLFFAVTFQLSGGLYMGALNEMRGGLSLMREDLLMCLYANLAGMAIYFPLLFRMKFRFTNKTLLIGAATGVLACNLLATHISFLPLLWAVCFVEGMCKIQGTFECMSNIQLWMTPKRDFTVFFPLLHIVILGSMQLSDLLMTCLLYYYHWTDMHLFMAGMMLVDLLILFTCIRHFRTMKKFPLFGVDWIGALLWAALLLEVAYLFDYGNWYDWWASPVVRQLTWAIGITGTCCLWRMFSVRHPYLEPQMWRYRYLIPLLLLITLVEVFLATERVLEETFLEEVVAYGTRQGALLDGSALAGVVTGCLFAYWWMHIRRFNYLRLLAVGVMVLAAYLIGFYFMLSADISLSKLCLPVFLRSFAYAVLSATFMVCLEEIMTFQHFFQALGVFNMLHMVIGGVMGSAIYGEGLSYYMADNIARYGEAVDRVAVGAAPFAMTPFMEGFIRWVLEVSLKQLYGWTSYGCLLLLLLFLLYDMPVRRELKVMPAWRSVAKQVRETFHRTTHSPREKA